MNNIEQIVLIIVVLLIVGYVLCRFNKTEGFEDSYPEFINKRKRPSCGKLPLFYPNDSACGKELNGCGRNGSCPPHDFYLRGNRYKVNKCQCGCKDRCECPNNCINCNCGGLAIQTKRCPCGCESGCSCGFDCNKCECKDGRMYHPTDINWSVDHEAGANNTCGDKLWHCMSPRMILEDNSLACGEHTKESLYNAPPGMLNDLASQYTKY